MSTFVRYLFLAGSFAALVYGDDLTVPMPTGGNIIIQHPQFIRKPFNIDGPWLTFGIVDKSSAPWESVKLQFDMGGVCNGEIRQWSASVVLKSNDLKAMALWGYHSNGSGDYEQYVDSLVGKVEGCRTEVIKVRIGEPPPEPLNLRDEVAAHKLKRESEDAARTAAEVEKNRLAEEEKAKRVAEREKREKQEAAADAARRKQLADEQKKKDAELDARIAKTKAEDEAKAAEGQRQVRAACALIYKNTSNKKVADLPVKEEQQVRTCQALDLYPPR